MVSNKIANLQHPVAADFMKMADYDKSVIDCAKNGNYSSIWTMLFLSTVVSRRIFSVYPAVNGTDDVPFKILNVTLEPRIHKVHALEAAKIMWTRVNPPVLSGSLQKWSPNHFVPIVDNFNSKADLPASSTLSTTMHNLQSSSSNIQPKLDSQQASIPPKSYHLQSSESNNPRLVEAHKGGLRLWFNGFSYVCDKTYKDNM